MVLALTLPARVNRLIVADMAPVAYGHSQAGYVRAMEAVDLAGVARRSDADAALAGTVPEAALRAFLLQSLELGPDGAAWKLNLPALGEQMALPPAMAIMGTSSTITTREPMDAVFQTSRITTQITPRIAPTHGTR
jgi:hypothetical protein